MCTRSGRENKANFVPQAHDPSRWWNKNLGIASTSTTHGMCEKQGWTPTFYCVLRFKYGGVLLSIGFRSLDNDKKNLQKIETTPQKDALQVLKDIKPCNYFGNEKLNAMDGTWFRIYESCGQTLSLDLQQLSNKIQHRNETISRDRIYL